ncbi:MAG: hypothetical protein KJI69_00300 [Patescibacteria group bacterium]|nr:hypothetical protein [Patescibacteria group bacterium]
MAESEDGDLSIEILPSSVTDWQGLTVEKVDLESLPPTDGTFRFGSKAFEISFTDADGNPIERFQLNRPAVITVSYTEAEALYVYDLAIFRYDSLSSTWIELNTSVDPVNRILTARVSTFSKFVIGIPALVGEPVPTVTPVPPVLPTATTAPVIIPIATPVPTATVLPPVPVSPTATPVPGASPTAAPVPTATQVTPTQVPPTSVPEAPTQVPPTSVPETPTAVVVVTPTSLPPATPSPTPIPVPVEPEEDDGFSVVTVIAIVLAAIALIGFVYFSRKKRKR